MSARTESGMPEAAPQGPLPEYLRRRRRLQGEWYWDIIDAPDASPTVNMVVRCLRGQGMNVAEYNSITRCEAHGANCSMWSICLGCTFDRGVAITADEIPQDTSFP